MIFIYSEDDKLIEVFDTAKELKTYMIEYFKQLDEDTDKQDRLNLNYDNFSEVYEVFTNGVGNKVKFT